MANFRLGASAIAACALLGCSLDTRQLYPEGAGGQAGSESQPLPLAGVGGSPAGAEAGADGTDGPLVDGCPDLDGNGVGDCRENLLDNGDFESDVKGWIPDSATDIVWDDQNAAGDTPSGSALLSATNSASPGGTGSVLRVVKQCRPLAGKQLVTAYANALVGSDQATDGHAEVDVDFFDGPSCSGTLTTGFSTPQPLDASPDQWLILKAGIVSGASTQSVLVSLALSQPLSAASFSARFDNVLLKKQTP